MPKRTIRPIPMDKDLYERIKKKVYSQYRVHSAYRSGALVKLYKEQGGKYCVPSKRGKCRPSKRRPSTGLTRWYKEKWDDIGKRFSRTRSAYIRSHSKRGKKYKWYPVYRPTRRVDSSSPLTVDEIDPKHAREQMRRKQSYKHKTLGRFRPKK